MRNQVVVKLAGVALCALLVPYAQTRDTLEAQTSYVLTDLGTLGGVRSSALSVNESGRVVGSSETPDGTTHAFLYTGSSMIDLGTLGGDNSYAYRINDIGIIAGRAQEPGGAYRPFVALAGGPMFDISAFDPRLASEFSAAHGLNRWGQIVGLAHRPGDHMSAHNRAFLYFNFVVEDFGTFGGEDGVATAVNDVGQMVGSYGLDPHADYAYRRAFLAVDGKGITIPTFGGQVSEAADLNNSGYVIGKAQTPSGDFHAFLYRDGSLTDLGTFSDGRQSYAYGINDAGEIVGAAESRGLLRAFVYRNGKMIDLNTLIPSSSGWVLTEARDISDNGTIVGMGIVDGQQRAFRLTRVP